MKRSRRFFLRARSILWTALSLTIIIAAMLVGVANLVLPYADNWRPEAQTWLTERFKRPVTIGKLEANWAAFGPQLIVRQLTVGEAVDPDRLQIEMADIRVDLFAWLKYGSHGLGAFRLLIDELTLARDAGAWQIAGFTGANNQNPARQTGSVWSLLGAQSMIGVNVQRVRVIDAATDLDLELPGGEVRFHNQGDLHRAAARLGSNDTGFVDVTLELNPEARTVEVYATSQALNLAALDPAARNAVAIDGGEAGFEVWAHIQGSSQSLEGMVSLTDLTLAARESHAVQGIYHLDSARSDFRFVASGSSQWQLDLAGLEVARSAADGWAHASLGIGQSSENWTVNAHAIRASDLLDALMLTPALPPAIATRLASLNPQMTVNDLDLTVDRTTRLVTGHVNVNAASWSASDGVPGVNDLSIAVRLEGSRAHGSFQLADATLDLTPHMRAPLEGVEAKGDFILSLDDQPTIDVTRFDYREHDVHLSGRALFRFNGGRPFVDFGVQAADIPIGRASDYLIVSRMPPTTVRWLDERANRGLIESGSLVVFGDLDDWPFREGQGTFKSTVSVTDVSLDYAQGWPEAAALSANLEFFATGMEATILGAQTQGVFVDGGSFSLPVFKAPIISMRLKGHGDGNRLLAFLRQTPLRDQIEAYAGGIRIDGRGNVITDIVLPLRENLGERVVSGSVAFTDADILDEAWGITFESTHGTVEFTRGGFRAERLATRFNGTDAELTVRAGNPALAGGARLEGMLSGHSHPQVLSVFAGSDLVNEERVGGAMDWTARLSIPANGPPVPHFSLMAELTDLEIGFPAPLAKPAGQPMDLRVDLDMAPYRNNIRARLGDELHLAADRSAVAEPWRVGIRLGSGAEGPPELPGLTVNGMTEFVDIDGWIALLRSALGDSEMGSGMPRIDVDARQLLVAGRRFEELNVKAGTIGENYHLSIDGETLKGRLRLPRGIEDQRLLLAEFERVVWPEAETEAPVANIDPALYPPMDFYAAEMVFENVTLGEVRFATIPGPHGLKIEEFSTQAGELRLNATGEWLSSGDSRFSVTATSADLGATLDRFGFSEMVDGGQLLAQLNARWLGAPSDFELARMNGDLDISIGRGQIVEVQPGAGRIFGLLSVSALPRRLLLDFSDLFKTGLTFDRIRGNFTLENGLARTENLTIESPTADVLVVGTTDLAAREYDQMITVVPKVGESLPLVGAIAGGGVGAAALFVLQGVFRNQIDRITQYNYSVTGPWADPSVELLGAEERTTEPPPETAAVP